MALFLLWSPCLACTELYCQSGDLYSPRLTVCHSFVNDFASGWRVPGTHSQLLLQPFEGLTARLLGPGIVAVAGSVKASTCTSTLYKPCGVLVLTERRQQSDQWSAGHTPSGSLLVDWPLGARRARPAVWLQEYGGSTGTRRKVETVKARPPRSPHRGSEMTFSWTHVLSTAQHGRLMEKSEGTQKGSALARCRHGW